MADHVVANELANEIALMQQELIVKRMLLEESREKLQLEMSEHKETKSNLAKYLNENKELKAQLEISLKAAQNLELENVKNREVYVKLQVQTNSYLAERRELLDKCYNFELENDRLKNEITDLKEQLEIQKIFQENYRVKQNDTESLINEILSKQEILKKEQSRLETVCLEGLSFASKVSNEAQFQAKFILEANAARVKMEEQIIRLLTVLKQLKKTKEEVEDSEKLVDQNGTYAEEWKEIQKKNEERVKELLEENSRLGEELNLATSQIELLLSERKKDSSK